MYLRLLNVIAVLFLGSCANENKERPLERQMAYIDSLSAQIRPPRTDVIKFRLMSTIQGCDASVLFSNPIPKYSGSEDKHAVLYLEWQILKVRLSDQERMATEMGKRIGLVSSKEEMIKAVSSFKEEIIDSRDNMIGTAILDELLELHGWVYSYYCESAILFDSIILNIQQSKTLKEAKTKFIIMINNSSEAESDKMSIIHREFVRTSELYGLSKK